MSGHDEMMHSTDCNVPRERIGAGLFNCLPGWEEPDWTQFDAVEIQVCFIRCGHCDTPQPLPVPDRCRSCKSEDFYTEAGSDEGHPRGLFFTVYGHYKPGATHAPHAGGGVNALTDCLTRQDARTIARLFAAIIGGPLHDYSYFPTPK